MTGEGRADGVELTDWSDDPEGFRRCKLTVTEVLGPTLTECRSLILTRSQVRELVRLAADLGITLEGNARG